jgi:hypothetical protein
MDCALFRRMVADENLENARDGAALMNNDATPAVWLGTDRSHGRLSLGRGPSPAQSCNVPIAARASGTVN